MMAADTLRRPAHLLVFGLTLLGLAAGCAPALPSAANPAPVAAPSATVEAQAAAPPTQAASPTPQRPVGTAVGMQAPDLGLETLEGTPVRLSDYRGQVVVLNFWATWCGPCRMEVPGLVSVYGRYREKGFTILAVNLHEPRERVEPFVRETGIEFPVLLDAEGLTGELYAIRGIPTSYFLDREGVVRQVVPGAMPEEAIVQLVEPLLDS